VSRYCRAGRLPQTGLQSSQLDHCDEPLQGAYAKTWQHGMPKYSRESSFDRYLSFYTRSELNTATLPRDSRSGPLRELFCSLLVYDPCWSPPLHILRSPAPRNPFHAHSHHRGRDHRHSWRRRLPHPPLPARAGWDTHLYQLSPLPVVSGLGTVNVLHLSAWGGGRALNGYYMCGAVHRRGGTV